MKSFSLFFFLIFSTSLNAAIPVIQSYTEPTKTYISVVLPINKKHSVSIESDSTIQVSKIKSLDLLETTIHQYEITNLEPGKKYFLKVYDQEYNLLDSRSFGSIDFSKEKPNIAVMSCSNQSKFFNLGLPMKKVIEGQTIDAIFHLGDFYYIDTPVQALLKTTPSLEQTYKRIEGALNSLGLMKLNHLVPFFAVYSDHDFGHEAANTHYPFKEITQNIFRTLLPIPHNTRAETDFKFQPGPGVSFALQAWKQQFVFVDSITFYDPRVAYLGENQEKWLKGVLSTSGTIPTMILDQSPLISYRNLSTDRAEVHPSQAEIVETPSFFSGSVNRNLKTRNVTQFNKFMDLIRQFPHPYVFVGGDAHLSYINNIPKNFLGYPTYQITSSGLHSFYYWMTRGFVKIKKTPNLSGLALNHNFLMIKPHRSENDWSMEVSSLSKPSIIGQVKHVLIDKTIRLKNSAKLAFYSKTTPSGAPALPPKINFSTQLHIQTHGSQGEPPHCQDYYSQ